MNIVALPLSSSSIVINWSPPIGNHIIGAYTVHYKQLGKPVAPKTKVISKDTHSYEVQGLLGYTNYSFYMKAYAKAFGYESEPIVQRTLEDRKLLHTLIIIFLLVIALKTSVYLLHSRVKNLTESTNG